MPLPETQIRECLKAAGEFVSKRRPPPEVRDQSDLRADIIGQELTIVSVRPAYDDPSRKADYPVAKARWVETQKVWKLFWMQSDLKWHAYTPLPKSPSIARLLEEVDQDPHCCFFG
jgi:Protein of unknown function (DUF3024).